MNKAITFLSLVSALLLTVEAYVCRYAICRSAWSELRRDLTSIGIRLRTGLGYDWWVGPSTSVGVLGRAVLRTRTATFDFKQLNFKRKD